MSQTNDTESGTLGVLGIIVDNPFVTNPCHDQIYPGTTNGSKLYLTATKSLEESRKVELSIENSIAIRSMLTQASNNFGLDKCTVIPTTWDSNGQPKTFSNLLLDTDNAEWKW